MCELTFNYALQIQRSCVIAQLRKTCISNTSPSPTFAVSPAWTWNFHGGLLCWWGAMRRAKLSVLEAIYFLAAFTSFQTHADRQIINFHEAKNPLAVTRLVADYQRGRTAKRHRIEARLILEPTGVNGQRLRKEILLDGVKRHVSDIVGHFNAVIFVPQMSQIIEGGPEERRRYLNLALAQAVPAYARVLSEYSQALTQRNALLKALNERSAGTATNLKCGTRPWSSLGRRSSSGGFRQCRRSSASLPASITS